MQLAIKCMTRLFNLLVANVAFSILLWLTPDDFTRQWETSWPLEGWSAYMKREIRYCDYGFIEKNF